ncbi:MAG: BON domain-containing protein [Anaerolineae bacterium]|jgi:osmotically-inducible protein OsmY
MVIEQIELAKRVEDALAQDPRTEDLILDVVDQNGMVTLTGTVPSHDAREAAEDVARQQEGVIEVVNDLEVDASAPGFAVVADVTDR